MDNFKDMTRELKKVFKTHLLDYVDYVESPEEALAAFLSDAAHGCASGIFGEFIYYSDTEAFYKRYMTTIDDYIADCGMSFEGERRANDACWFVVDSLVEQLATELVEKDGVLDGMFEEA